MCCKGESCNFDTNSFHTNFVFKNCDFGSKTNGDVNSTSVNTLKNPPEDLATSKMKQKLHTAVGQ